VVFDHLLVAALIAGVLVALAVFAALIRVQVSTWGQAAALLPDERERSQASHRPGSGSASQCAENR
jgi:hypothetical protein